jgi:hypothetical protein
MSMRSSSSTTERGGGGGRDLQGDHCPLHAQEDVPALVATVHPLQDGGSLLQGMGQTRLQPHEGIWKAPTTAQPRKWGGTRSFAWHEHQTTEGGAPKSAHAVAQCRHPPE